MEGMVARPLFCMQSEYLTHSTTKLTIRSWATQFISRLLQITHAQWVFRNVTLHDAHTGYLADCRRKEILKEIDELANMDPAALPEANHHLLEMDFTSLRDSSIDTQSYWLLVMRCAITAGRR